MTNNARQSCQYSRTGVCDTGQSRTGMWFDCVSTRAIIAGSLPCMIAFCCLWPFVIKMALNDGAELGFFNFRKVSRDRDYVFVAAFFDDRLDSSHPSIRVLGYHRRARTKPLFCRIVLHGGQSFCIQEPAIVIPLDPSRMRNKNVLDHFYICRLAHWHRPVTISLGISPICDDADYERDILDVRYSSPAIGRVRRRSGFGVCLSDIISRRSLRSPDDVQSLVECIEMNAILGMDKMYIYVGDMSPEVAVTLRKYTKRGLVEIIDWSVEQSGLSDHGLALLLNDCLYCNMDANRYLVFSGVDQLVVPRHQRTWRALMENVTAINHSKLVGAYSFAAFRYYDESTGKRPTYSHRSMRGFNASYRLPRIVTHRVRDRMPNDATAYNSFVVEPRKVISVAATRVSRMIPDYRCVSVSPILCSVHQFESRTRLKANDLQTRVVVDSSQDKYVPRLLKMLHQRFYRK